MTKFDIIVSWPRNADYPLWRQFIRDNRERFNLVIIVFTETHHGDDYRAFVREAMAEDWVLFIDNPALSGGRDWRDVAVNNALIQSYNAQWVWFTEQDFIPGPDFWRILDVNESVGVRAIGVKQGERLHPCSLFLRRDLLSELDKDFAANPPKYDHFGLIQQQLEDKKEPIGIIAEEYWQHLNGLSHNMRMVEDTGRPNYQPEIFNDYIAKCLKVSVPQDPRFIQFATAYLEVLNNGITTTES